MISNRTRTLLTLLGVLLLLQACSDQRFGAGTAPDFELPGLLDDRSYRLSALQGKVVYLTFWASWCGPCRQEMPFLIELHRQYAAQGLQILAVGVDENPQDAVEFILGYEVPFAVADDSANVVRKLYKVEGMPTHFIIDRDGRVHYSHMGFKEDDRQKITEQVNRLLGQSRSS